MNLFILSLTGFFVSLLMSFIIVYTKNWHGKYTFDSLIGDQKFHSIPTPRIGGISIFISILILSLLSFGRVSNFLLEVVLSSIPIFFAGILEDTTKFISVKIRLFCSFLTALIFIYLSGKIITSIDLIGFDFLLSYKTFSIIFTIFAIMGLINSINIIDGFNGLASGTVILILLSFAIIFYQLDDKQFFNIAIILTFTFLGFLIVNFPKGLIFLGDSGAYLSGLIVVILAIILPFRHPEVSPWVSFLICSYPIIETIFSIIRKTRRKGHNMSSPDKVHLHMLIYRGLSQILNKKLFKKDYRNPLTSIIVLVLPFLSGTLSIIFYKNVILVIFSIIFIVVLYLSLYKKVSLNWTKI